MSKTFRQRVLLNSLTATEVIDSDLYLLVDECADFSISVFTSDRRFITEVFDGFLQEGKYCFPILKKVLGQTRYFVRIIKNSRYSKRIFFSC